MRAQTVPSLLLALVTSGVAAAAAPGTPTPAQPAAALPAAVATAGALYIVQAGSTEAALKSVRAAGAEVQQRLEVIRAVSAHLTPAQVERVRATSGVRLFEDRKLKTSGSLLSLLKNTTNATNSTLATSVVGTVTSQAVTPLVGAVTTTQVVSNLTAPLVQQFSQGAQLKDGTGVAGLMLTYETNYPALIGADSLQRAGITGKGVTIAVLDTGLW